MKAWLASLALAAPLSVAYAQDGSIWVNPKEFKAAPGLIDEKIHDSNSTAINIARSLSIEQLSSRLEAFVEKASTQALGATLGGTVEPGEIKPVAPNR